MAFVRRSGHRLLLDGQPFYFVGTNCYYALTRSADASTRPAVLEVLDLAVAHGITVLRAWAFADGPDQWNALQPSCGDYDEKVLCGLDWLVCECKRRRLYLLLALTNYWPDFGGMPQYVKWSEPGAVGGPQPEATVFYASPSCQHAYQRFLRTVVQRVNTLTGVANCDEPSILGWELANEPRCLGDLGGTVLKEWISSGAAFLRSLDSNHLIGIGSEGFFGASTPDLWHLNPYPGAEREGVDFLSQHLDPNIDFASFHAYPDHWGHGCGNQIKGVASGGGGGEAGGDAGGARGDGGGVGAGTPVGQLQASSAGPAGEEQACSKSTVEEVGAGEAEAEGAVPRSRSFLGGWVDAHADVCLNLLCKPLILSEFGVYRCTCAARQYGRYAESDGGMQAQASRAACRTACFEQVLGRLQCHASSGGPLVGAAFWMLAAQDYPDYDGFTLYGNGCGVLRRVVKRAADTLQAL